MISIIALISAWLGYYLITNKVAQWFFYNSKFDSYWKAQSIEAIEDFREYVAVNKLSVDEALEDTEWNKKYSHIFLFMERAYLYEEKQKELNSYMRDEYEIIYCSDGAVYATSYSMGDWYFWWWETIGLLFALILFICIIIPFILHTIHRIDKLYKQVLQSTKVGMTKHIKVTGCDEIAELGREIESMRESLVSLLASETHRDRKSVV